MPSFQSALKSLPAKSLASLTILTLTIAILGPGCGAAWAAKPPAHRITLYGPPNADDLVKECREFIRWDKDDREGESSKAQACLSYVVGVFDGQSFAGGMNGKSFPVCVDSEVTQGQLVKVIVKYGDEHPEILHELPIYLINAALKSAYPCR